MSKPELIETKTEEVKVLSSSSDLNELTVQQEAHLLHILHVRALKEKLDVEAAQMRNRQEKIKYIHGILQDINNTMDKDGGIDVDGHPDLKEALAEAKKMGIKLPDHKEKYSSSECKRIMDNLHYTIDDWEKEDSLQMRKLQNMYTESEQSILIAKNTMSSIDRPVRSMISGIKGS